MPEELNVIRQTVATLDHSVVAYLGQRALFGYNLEEYQPGWSFGFYKELISGDDAQNVLNHFLPSAEAKYTTLALPLICSESAPENGAVIELDCNCIWAIMLRMRTSVRVAVTKYRLGIGGLREAINAGDAEAIRQAITIPSVEETVLDRILLTATNFVHGNATPELPLSHFPDAVAHVYRDWVIPMSCDVQVRWLFRQYGIVDEAP